ncbi:MAG TPA: hypothetical protein VFN91_03425 [Myxococcaceae bacterium]|nr:hypothetical protein [Myxococcaceae bacterium]
MASTLPEHLADTGLYADRALRTPAPGVLAYTPQYPLWSDGATKRRWIQLPRGTSIDAHDADAWIFPVGTRVWKEFSRGRRRETRLIVRTRSGWVYGTYRWTDDGADALLVPAAGAVAPDPDGPGGYVFPSEQDCRSCHEGRPTPILGFSALQLSADRDPQAVHGERPGPGMVDLDALVDRRLIRGLPARWRSRPPRIDAATDEERAALGYLHGNCGQCHNRRGPLANLGLDLWLDPSRPGNDVRRVIASLRDRSHFHIPGAAGTESRRLTPGAPERSAILVRMLTRDPAQQMPPVATRTVDAEAARRIERWIEELPSEATP